VGDITVNVHIVSSVTSGDQWNVLYLCTITAAHQSTLHRCVKTEMLPSRICLQLYWVNLLQIRKT